MCSKCVLADCRVSLSFSLGLSEKYLSASFSVRLSSLLLTVRRCLWQMVKRSPSARTNGQA